MTTQSNKREFVYNKVSASILRETEKAYQLSVSYWTQADKPSKEAKMWCPKSCCKVVDGSISEIAEFILRNWMKEHNEYIRSFTHVVPNISFDMDEKARRMQQKKEKDEACKKAFDTKISFCATATEPYVVSFMRELGYFCTSFGAFIKSQSLGISESAIDEMVVLGKSITRAYGDFDKIFDYEKNIQHHGASVYVDEILYSYVSTSAFGDLFNNPKLLEKLNSGNMRFYDVRDTLESKVFKKAFGFKAKFNELCTPILASVRNA